MKTTLAFTALLLGLCFLIPSSLLAQHTSSFKVSLINHGIFATDSFERYDLDKNTVRPLPSFNIGFIHSYRLLSKRNLYFNFGLFYEYAAYGRLKVNRFDNGGLNKRKEIFQSQYINMPLELEYKLGKFSLVGGAQIAFNFYTKFTLKSCSSGNDNCSLKKRYGSEVNINQPSEYSSRIAELYNGRLNIIYTAGLYYQWKPHIKWGLTYRDFFYNNAYLHIQGRGDYIDFQYYNYQTNSISVSILYSM